MLVTTAVAAVEYLRMEGVLRLRIALAIHVLLIGLAFLLGRRRLLWPTTIFGLLAGGLTAFGLATSVAANGLDTYVVEVRLVVLLAGYAIVAMLIATSRDADPLTARVNSVVSWKWPAAVFVVALVALIGLHATTFGDFDLGLDEIIYVLQSRWLREPAFGATYDPPILAQARLPFTFVRDGHLYGQYPPGWPFAIALADKVGLFSYTGAILGAISVVLCFAIATQFLGLAGGLASAALLLFQPWFWQLHRGLMSHELTITFTLLAAWLLLRAARVSRHRRAWLLLAGLAAGWVVAARPLTGMAVIAGLLVWKWISEGISARQLAADTVFLAGGVAVPTLLLLGYNLATTGDPLRFGYTAVHGHLHDLGFGHRGFIHGDQFEFTPVQSLWMVTNRMQDMTEQAIGLALLLPVIAVALARRVEARWRIIIPLLMLPAAYFFYFSNSWTRMYSEILPFVIVGWVALMLRSRLVDRIGFAAIVVTALIGDVLVAGHQREIGIHPNVGVAVRSVQERGKRELLVVLVDTLGAPHGRLWPFFALGGTPRDSRPLVFHAGPADSDIVRRFSDRVPLQVHWAGPNAPPIVRELRPGSRPTSN